MSENFVENYINEMNRVQLYNLTVRKNSTEVVIKHHSFELSEDGYIISDTDVHKASVIVLTYRPKKEKLFFTLNSVISQTNIDYEVIISDDGSDNALFVEGIQYLESRNFHNYTFILHMENGGTVKNTYDALRIASGNYIKLLSPGDALITEETLNKWCNCLEKSGKKWSFGEAVYYERGENGAINIVKRKCHPQIVDCYTKGKDAVCRMNYVGFLDNVLGAATLCERKTLIGYIERIVGKVKYLEDSSYYIMMFDGVLALYNSELVVLYEDGCGISTSGNRYWLDIIEKEWGIVRKIMAEGKDEFDRVQEKILKACNRKYYDGLSGQIMNRRWILDKGRLRFRLKKKYCPRMSPIELPDVEYSKRLLDIV